ncbi:MAG: hypothetical protein KF798_03820 [Candidatus Paracaedibacteraceae bacterium]|nr:hypothetical protein [Candidatus Paracaedibacteraceae bacterium]
MMTQVMIKFLCSVLFMIDGVTAQDSFQWTLPSCPEGVGMIETRVRQDLVICSQARYDDAVRFVGMEDLPQKQVGYKQLSLPETITLFQSGEINFVAQGDAKILNNPKAGQYFATHSLMDCVGVSIWTPKITYFSHMDLENIKSGKLGRLLDRVDITQRGTATVSLVSAYKSGVLSNVLSALDSRGFQDIRLDVEESVLLFFHDHTEKLYPVSAFGGDLSKLEGKKLADLEKMEQVGSVAVRSLIIDAQTGQALRFCNRDQRAKDHHILYQFQQSKQK